MRFGVFLLTSTVLAVSFGSAQAADYYLDIDAEAGGNGSMEAPFSTIRQVLDASSLGDTILLAPGRYDGAFVLKPGQKLMALGAGIELSNSEGLASVLLADGVEISGIEFNVGAGPAIQGASGNYSGVWIHDNLFSGGPDEADDPVYAVELHAADGKAAGVRFSSNRFLDGENMGGLRVIQTGDSRGEYLFEDNIFRELGGRAYYIQTRNDSHASTEIRNDRAENIGLGNRNSDSILPYLMGASSQTMTVSGYRYANLDGVGNGSNTGLEVFIYGWPRPEEDRENWCDGCSIRLNIEDSFFMTPATDGIQLTNYGANSEMHVAIRNTRIINPAPRQVGGAVSVVAEKAQNSGGNVTVLVENSDLIGSTRHAVAVNDETPGQTAVVDLGGGPLGSEGYNRIIGTGESEIRTQENPVWALYNWWGGEVPEIETSGDGAVVDAAMPLVHDPRP